MSGRGKSKLAPAGGGARGGGGRGGSGSRGGGGGRGRGGAGAAGRKGGAGGGAGGRNGAGTSGRGGGSGSRSVSPSTSASSSAAGSKDKYKEGKKRKRKKKGLLRCLWKAIGGGYFSREKIEMEDQKALSAVQSLNITNRHLVNLRARFDEIDLDASGSIDAEEFFEMLQETRSPFTDALFRLIDLDGSGTIEFGEYIQVMITYCIFTKTEILRFCFNTFDADGSGTIDEKEFVELCRTVNNASPLFPGNFASALNQFDINDDGLIDFPEFIELDRRFPLVLFPAFRLQDRMQKMTLGEARWREIMLDINKARRVEEYKIAHGGKEPPESGMTKFRKRYCCLKERKVDLAKLAAARPDMNKTGKELRDLADEDDD